VNQTRLGSLLEAVFNVCVGFSINWSANMLILPLFGFPVSGGQAFVMGLAFTVISVIRSYSIRRLFNYGLRAAIQRAAGWLAR
jgi:hypothetical protein